MNLYMFDSQMFEEILQESLSGLFKKNRKMNDISEIKDIKFGATDLEQCNVLFREGSVWSKVKFYPGDIIERCPCREVSKSSLYSRDVRDMVFEVVPDEEYVIPMGYCQFYDIKTKRTPVHNCDYEWNPVDKTIVIRAIKRIDKYEKLVLNIEK